MYTKNVQLAEKMWQKLKPVFENTSDLVVRFDHHGVRVTGLGSTCDEVMELIDEAEKEASLKWDMRTIHYLEKFIKAHGGIETVFVTSDELDEMVDYSAYYEFTVKA